MDSSSGSGWKWRRKASIMVHENPRTQGATAAILILASEGRDMGWGERIAGDCQRWSLPEARPDAKMRIAGAEPAILILTGGLICWGLLGLWMGVGREPGSWRLRGAAGVGEQDHQRVPVGERVVFGDGAQVNDGVGGMSRRIAPSANPTYGFLFHSLRHLPPGSPVCTAGGAVPPCGPPPAAWHPSPRSL